MLHIPMLNIRSNPVKGRQSSDYDNHMSLCFYVSDGGSDMYRSTHDNQYYRFYQTACQRFLHNIIITNKIWTIMLLMFLNLNEWMNAIKKLFFFSKECMLRLVGLDNKFAVHVKISFFLIKWRKNVIAKYKETWKI